MTVGQSSDATDSCPNLEDATMKPLSLKARHFGYVVKDESSSANSLTKTRKLLIGRSSPDSNWTEWNNQQYVSLHQVLQELSDFSEGDELYITGETREKSQEILDYLRAIGNIDAPKIFNQGDDCLIFSWTIGKMRKNLLSAIDEISLVIVDPVKRTYSENVISEDGALHLDRLAKTLSIAGISSGSSDN